MLRDMYIFLYSADLKVYILHKVQSAFTLLNFCYNLNMKKEYYYIDINLQTKAVVNWGTAPSATHTGTTDDPNVYRVFLTKGQFNKLLKHLD